MSTKKIPLIVNFTQSKVIFFYIGQKESALPALADNALVSIIANLARLALQIYNNYLYLANLQLLGILLPRGVSQLPRGVA